MKQKKFAEEKINCSDSLWSLVLAGKRNLGYRKALSVSRVLKTKVDLWINPETRLEERRDAWQKYILRAK